MRRAVVLGLVLLVGCSSEGEKAEREAEIVARSGDSAAICAAKRKVADAYLSDGNEAKYRDTKLSADIACTSAELDRSNYSR